MRRVSGVLLLVCLAAAFSMKASSQEVAVTSVKKRTPIVILGTATPATLSAERSGIGVAIIVDETAYLFDAGPGADRRLFEARQRLSVFEGVKRLGGLFLTHHHPDHTLGVPGVVLQPFSGPTLGVYGPPGTVAMMDHIRAAFPAALAIMEKGDRRWPTKDVTAGVIVKDPKVTISAFEVLHRNPSYALGYRIQTADRTVVVSGDTRPVDATLEACNGCDVLIHEINGGEDWKGSAGVPMGGHTSALELGRLATRAKAKLLVLYHQGYRGESDAQLIARIATEYRGPIISSRDFDVF